MGAHFAIRALLALSVFFTTVVLTVQPVTAQILTDTGIHGIFVLQHEYADYVPWPVRCTYESTGDFDLEAIIVKPPVMYGAYSTLTKVEWRWQILRDPPGDPVRYSAYANGPWRTGRASKAVAAAGFTRGTWTAPEGPTGRWGVVVEMRWWRNGTVQGRVRAQIERVDEKSPFDPASVNLWKSCDSSWRYSGRS